MYNRIVDRQLIVATHVNPLRAYSGVKYLCDALHQRGVDLELWAYIPRAMLSEISNWWFPVRSFLDTWYGAIPKFRAWASKLRLLYLGLTTNAAILFTDLAFVKQIALIKKLRSKKVLIHYCTEFVTGEEAPQFRRLLRFYEQFADIPDLIIEVEPTRARLRKEWYHLSKDPLVIPNTIPKLEVPPQSAGGGLAKLAKVRFPEGVPILLYSGGVYFHREFDVIIDALAGMTRKVFFLAFCYGDQKAIADLRRKCNERLGPDGAKICDSVARQELLTCIHEADAGIVYYPPHENIGSLYCAPTKMFEYIAVGLPVVSAPNPGLVKLIDEGGLGICAKDDTAASLREALESLLFNEGRLASVRKRQRERFESELCYELAAISGIEAIVDLLDAKGTRE
jgi:glycosyltransferase involved in cell wall biosynthesis